MGILCCKLQKYYFLKNVGSYIIIKPNNNQLCEALKKKNYVSQNGKIYLEVSHFTIDNNVLNIYTMDYSTETKNITEYVDNTGGRGVFNYRYKVARETEKTYDIYKNPTLFVSIPIIDKKYASLDSEKCIQVAITTREWCSKMTTKLLEIANCNVVSACSDNYINEIIFRGFKEGNLHGENIYTLELTTENRKYCEYKKYAYKNELKKQNGYSKLEF